MFLVKWWRFLRYTHWTNRVEKIEKNSMKSSGLEKKTTEPDRMKKLKAEYTQNLCLLKRQPDPGVIFCFQN